MSPREKKLVVLLGAAGFLLVNLGVYFKVYEPLKTRVARDLGGHQLTLKNADFFIEMREQYADEIEWLEKNVPQTAAVQEAEAGLQRFAQTEASRNGLTIERQRILPSVGDPGSTACLTAPGFKEGYLSIVPGGSSWRNECPARIGFTLPGYRPISSARRVTCPALIVMGEKDSLISPASVEKAASAMARAELVRLPVGHFEPYTGEWFEITVDLEARFLKEHLQARRPR